MLTVNIFQNTEEKTRRFAVLGLILTNREELTGQVKTAGTLGESHLITLDFTNTTANKIGACLSLPTRPQRSPFQQALKKPYEAGQNPQAEENTKGVEASPKHVTTIEAQSQIPSTRRKKARRGKLRKPLLRRRHKRGIYRKWKMGGITKEVLYLQK